VRPTASTTATTARSGRGRKGGGDHLDGVLALRVEVEAAYGVRDRRLLKTDDLVAADDHAVRLDAREAVERGNAVRDARREPADGDLPRGARLDDE
jgi:hypothetical protein